METDEGAFLAALAAAPDDEAPHKVYADWLDERHRPDQAAYHRRWTVALQAAEEHLAAFVNKPDCKGMSYEGMLRACERYLDTGDSTGTRHHFPENELVHYPRKGEEHNDPAGKFWRAVGLVLNRDAAAPAEIGAIPFSCCEFDEHTSELYPDDEDY